MTLLANETSRVFPIAHPGRVQLTVWWSDGRMTIKRFDAIREAIQVVGGNALPYKAFELVSL